MKRLFLVFIYSAFFSCSSLFAEEKVKLASLEWFPYVASKDGQAVGTCYELLREKFKQIGFELEVEFMPWKRVLHEVEDGSVIGGFPAYFTEERAKIYYISESYAISEVALFQHVHSDYKFETLEDLKNLKIGVVRGYANSKDFDAADFLDKQPVNDDAMNLKKLLLKRIDLAVMDTRVMKDLVEKTPEAAGKVKRLVKPLDSQTLHIIFSRKHPRSKEMLLKFNKALKSEKSGDR